MKIKIITPLLIAAFAILFSACTQTKKDANIGSAISTSDTLGLAEFQRWKMMNEIRQSLQYEDAMAAAPVQSYAPARKSSSRSYANSSRRSSRGTYASNGGYATNRSYPATQQQAPRRKKWSHTAKGAVVGGVSGAVIGAVANRRNRLGGGVVGAVIGAATGAGIGAIVDKRQRERGYYY